MRYEIKKKEKSQLELVITVEPVDYQKELEAAATRLSERAGIKGFRPGKAPYETVKQQLGDLKILEEALQSIVEKNFYQTIAKENVETLGMPQITIEKMAPGNDLIYRATAPLLPKVKLADFNKIKVERHPKKITTKETDEALDSLRKMRTKEITKSGVATDKDKVTVDLDMFIDKVPVEGGQAKNHQVYLNEPHYIPGLAEQLVGLKKDDTKEFALKFPKEHYQKHLAGKNVDFKIKVNEVFELQYPELTDEFAKTLGQESLAKLVELLTANLVSEEEKKEDQRVEIAILDQLIEESAFDELPEVLIDSEKNKMFYELKHSLDQQGISIEQYLKDLKKTEKEIFADFTSQAAKRAKAALISRVVAKENDIKVDKKELDAEIALIKTHYGDDPKIKENLQRPEVINTVAATVQNRKVMEFLKEKITKK